MKCRLSWLADDTSVGAVVDIFEGKGCLIQWNPDELDTRNDKSQSSTRTHTKSSACSRLILYTSISKYRRATLLLFSTWGGLSKDFTQRYTSRKHEAVDTHCSKRNTSWTYERRKDESEQKLKVEQERVYQKDCGRSILGDEENSTDKALTNVTEFWSLPCLIWRLDYIIFLAIPV